MWLEFSARVVSITQPPDSRPDRLESNLDGGCGAYKPGPEDTEVKEKALVLRTGLFLHSSLTLVPFHNKVCFLSSPTDMGVEESSYLLWSLRAS